MPRKAAPPRLVVANLGPIKRATVDFGDLTVFVGPQASGKTILLETLKLVVDRDAVMAALRIQGYDWSEDAGQLLDLYFGEGMRALFTHDTLIRWNRRTFRWNNLTPPQRPEDIPTESILYVPAHRALVFHAGWPRNFNDYSTGDPYVLRDFSEDLRWCMENWPEIVQQPDESLGTTTRKLLQTGIYGDYELGLERLGPRRRLILRRENGASLPFLTWSSGQREFSPLLLVLRFLADRTNIERARHLNWVVIEEPEMGLHPQALTAVLFLVLDLLERGYRVSLSTHSPHVLDLLWALRVFRERSASAKQVLALFAAGNNTRNRKIAAAALEKDIRVYSFDRQTGLVDDISRLDPDSDNKAEVTWGGLVGFSSHVSDVVADFIANARDK
jgi:hypothetical protein